MPVVNSNSQTPLITKVLIVLPRDSRKLRRRPKRREGQNPSGSLWLWIYAGARAPLPNLDSFSQLGPSRLRDVHLLMLYNAVLKTSLI